MKSILIIEDDLEQARFLELFLIKECRSDVTTDIVRDGLEALASVRNQHYDVIILDLMLHNLNGYAILDYLYGNAKNDLSHTVVISARGQEELRMLHEEYSIPCLQKPFDLNDLRTNVRYAFEH